MSDFMVHILFPLVCCTAVIALAIACFPVVPPLLIIYMMCKK